MSSSKARSRAVLGNINSISALDDTEASSSPLMTSSSSRLGPSAKRSASRTMAGRMQGKAAHANSENINTRTASSSTITKASKTRADTIGKVDTVDSASTAETAARDADEDDAQGRQQSEAYLIQVTNSVYEPFHLQAKMYAQRVEENGDDWLPTAEAQAEEAIRQSKQNIEHTGVGLAQLLKTPARARTRAPPESSSDAGPDFAPVPFNLAKATRPRPAQPVVDIDDDDTSQVVDDSLLNSPYKPPKSIASKATLNSSVLGPPSSVRSKSTRSTKGKGKALSEPENEDEEMPGDDAEVKSRRTKKPTKKSKALMLKVFDDGDDLNTKKEEGDMEVEVRASSRRTAAQKAEQQRKAMEAQQQQMLEDEEASQKAREDAEAAEREQEEAEAQARAEEAARLELERAEAEAAAAEAKARAEAEAAARAAAEAAAAAEEQARLEAETAARAKAEAEAAAAAEKEKKRLEKERKTAEKKRQEEDRAREKAEEQRKKREEKEAKQRQKEEEERLKREEQERKEHEKAEAEKKKKEEAERKKREEAERKKEEADRKKREEAERKKEEVERKKKELEEKKQKEKEAEEARRKTKLEQERREAEEAAARAVAAKMAAEKEAAEKAAAEAEEKARLAAEAAALAAEEEAARISAAADAAAAAAAQAQARAEAEIEADDEDDDGSDAGADGFDVDDDDDKSVAADDDFDEIQLEDEDMPRELVASGSRRSLDTNADAGSTVSVEAAEALRVVEANGAMGPTSSRSSQASQQQHRASSVARPGHIQSAKWNAGASAGKMGWKLSNKFTFNSSESSNPAVATASAAAATASDATVMATSPQETRNVAAAAVPGSRIGTIGRSHNVNQLNNNAKTGIPASTSRIASVQTSRIASNAIATNVAGKQRQVDTSASSVPGRKPAAGKSQVNGSRTPSSNTRSIKKAVPALTKKLVARVNNADSNNNMGPGSSAKKRKVSPQPTAATVGASTTSTASGAGITKREAASVTISSIPTAPASPSRRGILETAGAFGSRLLGLPSAAAKSQAVASVVVQPATALKQQRVTQQLPPANGNKRETTDGSTLRKVESKDGPFSSQNDFQQVRAKPSNASTASSSKSTLVNSVQSSQTKIKLKMPNGSNGSGNAAVPVRGSSLLSAPGSQVLQQTSQFQPSQPSQYFSQTQVETQSQTVMVTAPSSQDFESQNMAQGPLAPRQAPPQPPAPRTPSIRTLSKRKRYNDIDLEDADISLPDIQSEYSDSDDEMTKRKRQREAEWMRGDGLDARLEGQLRYDPEAVFGGFDTNSPPDLQRMLAPARGGRPVNIPRSSSANWASVQELERYSMARLAKVRAAAEAAALAAANGGQGSSAGPSRHS